MPSSALRSQHVDGLSVEASSLFFVEDERTDRSVRTAERALVALDTALRIPYRYESLDTTLLPSSGTILPSAVDSAIVDKVRDLEQVTSLSVDRTHKILDESRSVVLLNIVVSQISPCRILNGQTLYTHRHDPRQRSSC